MRLAVWVHRVLAFSPKALSKRVLILADEQRLLSVGPYYRHYLHCAQGVDLYVQSTSRTRAVVDALQLPHVEWIEGGVEDVLNVVKPKRNDYALIALRGISSVCTVFLYCPGALLCAI